MITVPIEDWIFLVAVLVGGVLLLIMVVFDDIVGGLLDGFGFDIGGTSVTPVLLAFIAMFGAGGLFATQVLDLHAGQAAVVGIATGVAGAALAGALFGFLRRSESKDPFKTADLVGESAYVSVAIPASRFGSVLVKAEGQTHEFAATSDHDIPAGRTVIVSGVAGSGLIVREETAAAGQAAAEED